MSREEEREGAQLLAMDVLDNDHLQNANNARALAKELLLSQREVRDLLTRLEQAERVVEALKVWNPVWTMPMEVRTALHDYEEGKP